MKPTSIELYSPLTVEECLLRLRGVVDGDGWFAWFTRRPEVPLAGRFGGNRLWLRKQISYRNCFQLYLNGTIRAQGDQTVIEGQFTVHPGVRVFWMLWFGFVALVAVVSLNTGFYGLLNGSLHAGQSPWLSIFIGVALPLFGYVTQRVGAFLSRKEPAFIKDLLVKTLEAEELTPES